MLKLRTAVPGDAAAIATLIHTLGQSFVDPGEEALAEEFWASVNEDAERAYLNDPGKRFIVAVVDKQLVGVIAVRDSSHVFHFFVDRRFQHRGLGTRLWYACLDGLDLAADCHITVNASMEAKLFYRKLGFVDAGEPISKHGVTTAPMRFERSIAVRDETPADVDAIASITVAAFATLEISGHTEHFIVEALRNAHALSISLVAEQDGEVVGHIAFSPVTITDGTPHWYGLGPVSVRPELQRKGIGKMLVHTGLARLQMLGASGCCLVGHPEYYRKFGFNNVAGLGVEGVPPEYFFALPFDGVMPQGTVTFHDAFMATGQTR